MKHMTRFITVIILVLMTSLIAQAQDGGELAQIRIAHFSPDTPAVEIYVNGELSGIQTLTFGQISGWVQLVPDTYSIAVAPAGTSLADAAIGPVDVTLGAGQWLTINAIGSLNSGTLTAGVVSEPYGSLGAGEASVTVFHGIEDAPNVDVILPDGTAVVQNLPFGSGTTINVPAGTYDLSVVAAGTTGPAVLDLSGTALANGTYYYVGAINRLATPQVALAAISFNTVAPLLAGGNNPGTVVDIALSDPNFSILVDALQAAGLVEALQGDGPFTVFAPTNAAFLALLADLGLTAEELFADTDLLTSVLLYHVAPTRAFSTDIAGVQGIATLQGSGINIGVDAQGVALDFDTRLLATDIQAGNGVVHVIDSVLIPR